MMKRAAIAALLTGALCYLPNALGQGVPGISPYIWGRPAAPCSTLSTIISCYATGAYSTRLVNSAYLGSALQAKRTSDNVTQDIGFVSGSLDTTTLFTFCGAGDCEVSLWYDQTGNGRVLKQQLFGFNLPLIVMSGSLAATIGGRPAVFFSHASGGGSNIGMSLFVQGSFRWYDPLQGSAALVANATTGGGIANVETTYQAFGGLDGPNWGFAFAQAGLACAPCADSWFATAGPADETPKSYTFGTDGIFSSRFSGGVSNFYVNGGSPSTGIAPNPVSADVLTVGRGYWDAATSFDGAIGELFIFNSQLSSANMNTVGANQGSYWGISWTPIP